MKITAIKTLVCNARMRNWIFVKVETDRPGLVGWGGSDTSEWHTQVHRLALDDPGDAAGGRGPSSASSIYGRMMFRSICYSSGIVER